MPSFSSSRVKGPGGYAKKPLGYRAGRGGNDRKQNAGLGSKSRSMKNVIGNRNKFFASGISGRKFGR